MRPLQKILRQFKIFVLLLFLFSIVAPSILLLFITFYPVRVIVWILKCIFRPDLDCFVPNLHTMLATQFSSQADLNVITCATFEGTIPLEYIRTCYVKRVVNFQKNGKYDYLGLRRTWTSFLGFAFWKIDKDFDIGNHIRMYDYEGSLAIPDPCLPNDLNRVLGGLIKAPWDRQRSPWECLIVHNFLKNPNIPDKTHTVLVGRFDHILGDAYGLSEQMRLLTRTPFQFPKIKLGDTEKIPLWKRVKMCLRLPYDTAANLYLTLGGAMIGGKKSSFKNEVLVSVSPTVNVEIVKKIKDYFNVPYATVLYAAMFGAIARAMKMSGQTVPDTLASGFVLPRPNHPKGMNIHLAVIFAEWPIKSHSSVDRMLKIQKNFERLSTSTAAVTYLIVANAGAFFPIWVRRLLVNLLSSVMNLSVGCTNFPATTGRENYDGHEMVDLVVSVGTLFSVGLITATGGLNNQQRFNFTVDKSLLGSEEAAQKLGTFVVQELQALLNATL